MVSYAEHPGKLRLKLSSYSPKPLRLNLSPKFYCLCVVMFGYDHLIITSPALLQLPFSHSGRTSYKICNIAQPSRYSLIKQLIVYTSKL